MSDIQKQLEIRDMVDNTPLREKLVEVKNWEKTMKQKEKDLKANNKVEVKPSYNTVLITRVNDLESC